VIFFDRDSGFYRSTTLDSASWQLQATVTPTTHIGQFAESNPADRAFFTVNASETSISYTFTPGSPVRNFARLKITQN
jgi:hypothetical protein